jgi:tRNA(Arg) A34 adenosine deaminase TadA
VRLTAQNRVVTEADPTRHAELLLVSEACRRLEPSALERATLYTSTEPCVMCCGAIYWSRIPRVVYGCSAVELGALVGGSLVIPSRQVFGSGRRPVEVVGPVLETEALAVHRVYWPAQ